MQNNNSSKKTKKPRVVIAMSGGVDSSVAAYLLKKQGYEVIGIFLKFWNPDYQESNKTCLPAGRARKPASPCLAGRQAAGRQESKKARENLCCDTYSLYKAREVADKLDIPFYVIDLNKEFKDKVVDYYIEEYQKGRTPNPCVECNKFIKFGLLWEKAKGLGADYLATGHYVRKFQIPNSKIKFYKLKTKNYKLMRAKDKEKDQSYFLWNINKEVLPYLLFPIGDLTKKEVRKIAKDAELPVYNKKDSQGVCFIPDGDNKKFLSIFCCRDAQSFALAKSGNIVDKYGNVLGKHKGLIYYTVGQREGLGDEIGGKWIEIQKNRYIAILSHHQDQNEISNKNNNETMKQWNNEKDIPPLYVIDLDTEKNQLVVGENKDVFSRELIADFLNILDERFWELVKKGKPLYAQIRGKHKAEKCIVFLLYDFMVKKNKKISDKNNNRTMEQWNNENNNETTKQWNNENRYKLKEFSQSVKILVQFYSPVRAITPGQSVAFYYREQLLGGAIIKKAEK